MDAELIDNGIRINDREYRIGDVLIVRERGRVIGVGIVNFEIYKDGESYIDDYHAGFTVKWWTERPESYFSLRTLPDLINVAGEEGWDIEKKGLNNDR